MTSRRESRCPPSAPATKRKRRESGHCNESDSEDDAPLVPAKNEVTEAALRQEIVPILRQVDLTAFSLKNLMARLSEEFGGADLKPHKPFIKEEVQRALADIQQGL